MSAKILSSLTDENRNLRKQIGCIFQIFDRRHILSSSRRLSGQDQNRIDLLEPKEKPRRSVDSVSRASNSSPGHSETQYERIATKEKEKQPPKILRDVVKDSMHREARSARNEEKRGNAVVKQQHVDSPRPLRRKPAGNERSKDDQETMSLRRFSCDGREARNEPRTRLKELPRLSLDSRAGSINLSSSSEPRLDFLDRFRVEHESRGTEPGNHHRRSSSIVAKLMGLEAFPDSTDENRTRNSISGPKELLVSPRLRCTDSLQDSPKMAPQSVKAFASGGSPHLSSSVYGEIEKRIAELEFKKSGKDLRALKQILEAMQKTRERIENQIEKSAAASARRRNGSEDLGYDPNSNSPTWQKRKIKGPNSPKSIDRSRFTSPASIDALNVQSRLQNSSPRSNNETTTPTRRKARPLEPRDNHLSSMDKKGFIRRDMEQDRTIKAPRGSKEKSCTISAKSLIISSSAFYGEESTRPSTPPAETVKVRKNLSKKVVERNSQDKRHKTRVKTPQLIDDTQLNEVSSSEVTCSSYQGDAISQNSESNYTLTSPVEADSGIKKQKYLKTRIEQIPQFQLEEASIEQPSPVSVLDAAFYSEDPPSPVRKITLAFQEDEDPIYDESEYRGSVMAAHKIRFSNIDQRVTSSNHDAQSAFGIHNITPSINSNVSSHLISPDMFHALEIEAAKKMKPNQKDERKIIPDLVNEILFRKNISGGLFTAAAASPQILMKEVSQEINSMNTIQSSNLDYEDDDGMLKLMASDMKHESEDWSRYKSEVPALVLDIERLIFKDLINEVLTNAAL